MKFRIKILLAVISLLVIYTSINLLIVNKGKDILAAKIKTLLKKEVTIGSVNLVFPFKLEIKNLDIKDTFKAKVLYVSPSILGLFSKVLVLNEVKIFRPELFYERFPKIDTENESENKTAPASTTSSSVSGSSHSGDTSIPSEEESGFGQSYPLRMVLKHLIVRDGKVIFTDYAVGKEPLKITFRNLNVNLNNGYLLPRPVITDFEFRGKIPWQQGETEGKITLEGWINLFKKDMQATLKIEGIDGVYLYPYYSNWVDLGKARIEKAKLKFVSKITGNDNDIVADCHLELTDIVRKPKNADERTEKAEKIANALLDIFKSMDQGRIELNFIIRTKMDNPHLGFDVIKSALETKIAEGIKQEAIGPQDIVYLPGKLIEGTFKGATDITTAVIGGILSVGKEIGKTVEATFKKERE